MITPRLIGPATQYPRCGDPANQAGNGTGAAFSTPCRRPRRPCGLQAILFIRLLLGRPCGKIRRGHGLNPVVIRALAENLKAAAEDLLTSEQLLRICGDGTDENPGIDANNRLIWGQVILWPEADGDWRIPWDDSQVFETRRAYQTFKAAWNEYDKVKKETTYRGQA